jgi:ribose transport system substrate-binding protein
MVGRLNGVDWKESSLSAKKPEGRTLGFRLRLSLGAILALLLCVLVAACGSSGDDTDAAGGGETTAGTEESSGGADLEGKKIGYLDVFGSAPIEVRFFKAFEAAAEGAGWSVQFQDAAGDQNKALTAARNFLNSGVDAIVCSSVPSEWLRPLLSEAQSKGVPLVEIITEMPPGVYDAQLTESAEKTSPMLAEAVQEDFPDGAEVGVTYEPEVPAEVQRLELLEKAFEGTNVEIVAVKEVPQIEAPAAQKAVVDMLNANPDISAFLALSDIQSSYALAGLRAARNKDALVYSWYADTTNVEQLKQDAQFSAVVDSDIARVGWLAVSELLTYFDGGEMTENQAVEVDPLIVRKDDLTPAMFEEEGPVPFSEIAPPFEGEWKTEFGIGG